MSNADTSLAYATLKTLSHPNQTQNDFFHKDEICAPETFNKIFGHVLSVDEVRDAIKQLQKEKEEREMQEKSTRQRN